MPDFIPDISDIVHEYLTAATIDGIMLGIAYAERLVSRTGNEVARLHPRDSDVVLAVTDGISATLRENPEGIARRIIGERNA